ncbi:PhoX family protein [Comamonas terrae]|uniref:PhoX family protein n=1 Tax=Comamonas terrae TaxID=673548 RepID=A0ABW5UGX7_9BURK|nr:alkaline phosphatase PhoX [Comamonas terrae]
MSHTLLSRRKALQFLSGAPLLPLGSAVSASTLLAACGGDDNSTSVQPPAAKPNYVSATFTGMAAPALGNPQAMATMSVGSRLTVNFDDQSQHEYVLGYQGFFNTGDSVDKTGGGKIVAGGYFDASGNPITTIKAADGTAATLDGYSKASAPAEWTKAGQVFSDCVDGSSLLKVAGAPANTVHAVVQYEYNSNAYGMLPSPIAVLTLNQDAATGKLTLKSYHNVNTFANDAHGLWIPCGGSLSPWGTHLSSEEYHPDAFDQGDNQKLSVLKAFSQNAFGNANANPYWYGHLPEVTVKADGTADFRKYYNLGRYSRELVQVFPDQRTVLGGDDSNNGGLFMFVADKAGDLSSGTLYVAKYVTALNETSAGKIQWIRLGHATSDEIKALANDTALTTVTTNAAGFKENGIFASTTTNPNDASFTEIKLSGKSAWVRLKPGQEKAAAFLETHRYAALKGGSLVFNKLEGTTVNAKDKIAYSAVSGSTSTFVASSTHNKELPLNAPAGSVPVASLAGFAKSTAGYVLQHKLGGGQKDDTGAAIDSEWVPTQTSLLLAGEPLAAPDSLGNTDAPGKISQPDNLKFSEKLRTLFIGEDSGQHVNNFMWGYNVDSGKLERVLSCPAGAESTGLHGVEDLNGWTYILSSFQHAGEYTDATVQAVRDAVDAQINSNYKNKVAATVGYITATPTQIKLAAK